MCTTAHEKYSKYFLLVSKEQLSLSNWNHQRIFLCVNALSAKKSAPKPNLHKLITAVGTYEYILQLIQAYSCFVCQHDVLHKNRMYKQDVIWRTKFGGFLQPMQVHLGWKQLCGQPSKRDLQRQGMFTCVVKSVGSSKITLEIESNLTN